MFKQLVRLVLLVIGCELVAADGLVMAARPEAPENPKLSEVFALAIHGGAGATPAYLPPKVQEDCRRALRRALAQGKQILASGGTSLDAVEQVIRILEDDPHFNAGRGAVLNQLGGHELDAAIMDGRSLACGAVASVRTVKNPISLARLVMTRTGHVLLAASGAERFADTTSVQRVDQNYFRTAAKVQKWQRVRSNPQARAKELDRHMGTVGCVALDRHGNLAAGTSTGGLTNKQFGRVGDSPLIGAGTYADNATCAISCTGKGEEFIRRAVAKDISARMAYQRISLDDAVRTVLEDELQPGDGGIIAVDHQGQISVRFNTAGMYRGAADWRGRFEVGIGRSEIPIASPAPLATGSNCRSL